MTTELLLIYLGGIGLVVYIWVAVVQKAVEAYKEAKRTDAPN